MTINRYLTFLLSAVIVTPFILPAHLRAQSAWLPPTDRSSISIEAYRLSQPSLPTAPPSSVSVPNGTTIFITARLRQRSGLTYVVELPVVRSDELQSPGFFGPFNYSSQTAIGNPYFGVSLEGSNSLSYTLDAGIRFPLAPKGSAIARRRGLEADFDRWEAFASEQVSFRALFGGRWSTPEIPFTIWIKSGGTLLAPNSDTDTEFLLDYQAGLWLGSDKVAFGSTFIGRTLLTESGPTFRRRSEFLLGFGANLTLGSIRPGVNVRFPLSNDGLFFLGSSVDAIYGANIAYLFGNSN